MSTWAEEPAEDPRRPVRRIVAGLALLGLAQGCALHVYCAPIRCPPLNPGGSAIARALDYLDQTQVKTVLRPLAGGADFPGNWPQYILVNFPVRIRARDVSPFLPANIHHSLTLIHEGTQTKLGLDRRTVVRARAMRRAAMEFMGRFAAPSGSAHAGAYGFWPRKEDCAPWRKPWLERVRGDWLAGPAFWLFLHGPALHGPLFALNVPQMPATYGIHSDADDTALIHVALLDAQRLDGNAEPRPPFHLFADWRDTGREVVSPRPDWLPEASGAFLTWFGAPFNDMDLVVNANVLYMLARFGRLDAPGAAEAQALIRAAVPAHLGSAHRDGIERYYPNPMMAYYGIARAFRAGPVPGLEPAAAHIADRLRRDARIRKDGSVHWNFGQPEMDTACGILVLLDAERHLDLVPGAIQYLVQRQDPRRGCWPEGYAFGGRSGRGHRINWVSAPFSTALALEALCRFVLAADGTADPRWRAMADLATASGRKRAARPRGRERFRS